jgi:hypothetical protein
VLKNFSSMPGILKWLTWLCSVLPIFLLVSLNPYGSIKVAGRAMPNAEWWASGAGVVVLVLAIAMTTAGILLLKRSPYGRPIYILGMLATFLSGPLIGKLTGSDDAEPLWSILLGILPLAAIAWYLYASKATRKYFRELNKLNVQRGGL